jgi:hypothetical protein
MALMAAKDKTGIPRSLMLDDLTRFLVTLDGGHHRIHLGRHFAMTKSQVVSDTNDITALVFSTPELPKYAHMNVEGQSTDQVEFRFIETPSVDEAEETSKLVPMNRHRNSDITSLLTDAEPVKAQALKGIEWTGVAEELDSFSIGDDVYLITQLEATATAADPTAYWIDLGDAQAGTMDGVAITAIDSAQATSANEHTVEASQGAGTSVNLDADQYGENGNLAIVIIVGANMVAVQMTGGVGAPNTGGDSEIHGVVNSVSYFDKTDAANANITTTVSLINEIIGAAAATPAKNSERGESRGEVEWLLKPSTQYCLYMKSLNAEDNTHTLTLHWYEVDFKDPTSSF